MPRTFGYVCAMPARLDGVSIDQRREEIAAYHRDRFPGTEFAGTWVDADPRAWMMQVAKRLAAGGLLHRLRTDDHLILPQTGAIATAGASWARVLGGLIRRGVRVHFPALGLNPETDVGRDALRMLAEIAFAEWPSRKKMPARTTTRRMPRAALTRWARIAYNLGRRKFFCGRL
jgi:hypothetical protein